MSWISPPADILDQVRTALEQHPRVVLAQIVRTEGSTPGKAGWKMLVLPDGSVHGNLGGGAFEALVLAEARRRLAAPGPGAPENGIERYYLTEEATRGQATGMVCGGMVEVFLETLRSPPVLAIWGGGPVGQALARAGALAGFELVVLEDRTELRRAELFPDGAHLPEVPASFRRPGPQEGTEEGTGGGTGEGTESADGSAAPGILAPWAHRELHVAVVSRCWETDTRALEAVLEEAPPGLVYLGLMGSRRKIRQVRRTLTEGGFDLSEVELHAPIGLPLGGDSPGEIAISIVAELLQRRHDNQPTGTSLQGISSEGTPQPPAARSTTPSPEEDREPALAASGSGES